MKTLRHSEASLGAIPRLAPTQSYTQRAYLSLRDAIVSLVLPPGELVSENSLAAQLGVSRSPVRNAIKFLEHEGLVVTIPQKGTFVSPLDARVVKDAIVMRRVLEDWAINEIIGGAGLPDVDALRRLVREQEEAAADGNYSAFFDLDTAFHGTIMAASGNDVAVQLFNHLNTILIRVRAWDLRHKKSLATAVEEHREILAAIERQDWERARHLIVSADDFLLETLEIMQARDPGMFHMHA